MTPKSTRTRTGPFGRSRVDTAYLLTLLRGDRELAREVVAAFQGDSLRLLSEIQGAVASGDLAQLEFSSHALKGAAGSIGAHRVAGIAGYLESLAVRGNVSDALRAQSTLRDALAQAVQDLQAIEVNA